MIRSFTTKMISGALIILALGCSNTSKTINGEIPLKDFFKVPIASQFRISPNGQKIAALRPYKDRMNLYVADFGKDNWKPVTTYKDRGVHIIGWKGNDVIIFTRDFGGNENFHLFTANIKSGGIKDLTPNPEERASIVSDLDNISETNIYYESNRRLKTVSDVYSVNVFTGEEKMILENPGKHSSWVIDHKGQIRIAVETDGVNNTFYYRLEDSKPFKKVKTYNFKETVSPAFFDFENKNVYALTNLGADKVMVVLLNPENFRTLKKIYSNDNYDISGLTYSTAKKEIVQASYVDWKLRRNFFSEYYKEIFKDIETKIPNKDIQLTSYNKEETVFTVYAGSDRSRGMYYTYDAKTKDLKFLMNPSPWIDENKMAAMKPIQYKSRDGLNIEGYLTLPLGKENEKGLPLIVNPHGGPWHRDDWGYSPDIQFLANRGYAVLQMNFRGSTGYGKKFWQASFKQWGQKMQDDITDGVNWAVEQGIADKNNICIYGASYGGYATLAGVTFTPDLYKCGVDYVGVSNLFTFQETIPPYWEPYKKMLYEMVGHPEKDKELLKKYSPVFHADKIKAALFVAQGANDPRVKKSESDQIVKALKDKGIDVPYMVKDNEGHGFHNQENQFDFYSQMEAFLDKHIKK